MSPEYLDLEDVLAIHRIQIDEFGGIEGVRDFGLLDSTLAQPRATFVGELLHEDLFAMAAAYLIHIARNHPLLDGNKRTALASALTFLDLNGFVIEDSPRLYALAMAIATGGSSKDFAADPLRAMAMPRRSE
jgi:death-on-curing protein